MEMDSSERIAASKSFCARKRSHEEVSFVNNLKNRFHDLTHASMEDHKTCFKASLKKVYEKVKNISSGGDLVEEPVSVPPTNAVRDRCFQAFNIIE